MTFNQYIYIILELYMSPENTQFGNDDGKEIYIVPIPKDVYKRLQKYANENDVTLEQAAKHFMDKGTPILEGIYKGVEKGAKERKRSNIIMKRQQKRKD